MNNNDTIFALSSGAGKSGVALIRVAGDNLGVMAREIIGRDDFAPRHAYFVRLRDGDDLIDECVVTFFAAPHSFTGTDVLEIAIHGAPAVIARVFEYLGGRFGARMAMPGEFSRRAFDNGKMDLADVDALAALLDARTERQRRAAIASVAGDSARYNNWREQMIQVAAYSAAITDYADDELPENIGDIVRARAIQLRDEISRAINRAGAVRALRGGFNIVLAGPTNAGKSSLFNRIVGANRAIVSDTPGTTRDVITATLDIDGYMVNIADTAGIRDETDDAIERAGIEKTHDEIANADLVIRLGDKAAGENEIAVINKCDLIKSRDVADAVYVSAKTGAGIEQLMNVIRARMHKMMDGAESDLAVNARTRGELESAVADLSAAIDASDPAIFAEHVRRAADSIGRILGVISAADVMDAAFSQLCLGK